MEDMMHLRRLYLTKRCLLAFKRKAILAQTSVAGEKLVDVGNTTMHLSNVASKLKQNATDAYHAYLEVACAVRRGVRLQMHA